MKAVNLNIAILPSDDVIAKAIEMSELISRKIGSRFVLNYTSPIPHITVYQARFPDKNLNKIINIAKALSFDQHLFEIKIEKVSISHETFLFWNCEKTSIMQNLQKRVVELANPLREGLIPSSLADVTGLSKEDRYDAEHFGALLIGSNYVPHVTITRLNNKSDSEKVIEIIAQTEAIQFKPEGLFVGYLGEHGTVTGIIKNFRFS